MSSKPRHNTESPLTHASRTIRFKSEELPTSSTSSDGLETEKESKVAPETSRSVRCKREPPAEPILKAEEEDPIEDSDQEEEQSQNHFYSQAQVLEFGSQQDQFGSQTEMLLSALETGDAEIDRTEDDAKNKDLPFSSVKKEENAGTPSTKESDGSVSSDKDDMDMGRPSLGSADTPNAGRQESLTDIRLRDMTQTGEIKEIVGSQSVFSQEMRLDSQASALLREESPEQSGIDAPKVKKEDEKEEKEEKNTDDKKAELELKSSLSSSQTESESQTITALQQLAQMGELAAEALGASSQSQEICVHPLDEKNSKTEKHIKNENSSNLEDREARASPKGEPLSCDEDMADQEDDEDEKIEEMERSGAMTQVIGSQSLLSQEITPSQVEEALGEVEEDEQEAGEDKASDKTPLAAFREEKPLTPASAARRYNLISTQEQEEVTKSGVDEAGEALHIMSQGGYKLETMEEDEEPGSSNPEAGEESGDDNQAGESLSQQLDLSGLSQDVDTSQDALRWADEQLGSQEPPTVTPANSATPAEEASQNTSSQMPLGLGFECLLQAADQVASQELRKSKRSPKRSRKINEMEQMEEESKRKRKAKSPFRRKSLPTAAPKPAPQQTEVVSEEKPERRNKRKAQSSVSVPLPAEASASVSSAPATSKPVEKKKTRTTSHPKPDQGLAQRAADLAARVINEEHLGKQLLLSMVMERQPTRTPPSTLPPPGSKLPASFVWSHYPPLEKILRDHMEEYYHLSLQKRQSAAQQAFNNALVHIVRDFARDKHGWTIPTLCEKGLRDRIRCYYKTHIQNAKKRLATMLKNPRKVANARHLIHHLDLIQATLANPMEKKEGKEAKKSKSKKATNEGSAPSTGKRDTPQQCDSTTIVV